MLGKIYRSDRSKIYSWQDRVPGRRSTVLLILQFYILVKGRNLA
jgi:hypothetical protein